MYCEDLVCFNPFLLKAIGWYLIAGAGFSIFMGWKDGFVMPLVLMPVYQIFWVVTGIRFF